MKRFISMFAVTGIFATQVFALQVGSQATVPEPGTLLLVAAGLGAVGIVAWRNRRKKS